MIQGYYEDGTFQFGETLFYPNYESFTIVYRFNEPYTDDGMAKNYSTLEREIRAIYAPIELGINEFCPSEIDEYVFDDQIYGDIYPNRGGRAGVKFFGEDSRFAYGGFVKNECVTRSNAQGQWIDYGFKEDEIVLNGVSKFYFPYDNLSYQSLISIVGIEYSTDNDDEPKIFLAPKIVGEVWTTDWDVKVYTKENNDAETPNTYLSIEYARPLLYRLLVPLILLLVFGVIIFLPFIKDTSTYIQALIGIIFGLWGLHDVLIPPNVTWPTIIDSLILFLYSLLGFVVFLNSAIIPLWKKWTAYPQTPEYEIYECVGCGKLLWGYQKEKHLKKAHKGEAVEWKRMG